MKASKGFSLIVLLIVTAIGDVIFLIFFAWHSIHAENEYYNSCIALEKKFLYDYTYMQSVGKQFVPILKKRYEIVYDCHGEIKKMEVTE